MKIFILSDDMSGNGPVWMNIFWPHYTAFCDCADTVLLSTPYRAPEGPGRVRRRWNAWAERRAHGRRLCGEVTAQLDGKGPGILLVWALNVRDIQRAEMLAPVWDSFDLRVLWVLDTIDPRHVDRDLIRKFDLVASICGDIGREFGETADVPTLYMPPHTDVLRFGTTSDYRPIDLLAVGRRIREIYDPVHLHFNAPGTNRVSVDFQTRTGNFSASTQEECQLLMAGYSRARIAFCFEPSTSHARFRGHSPLTERWPHAWSSGCTVVGSRPKGLGTAEQMDWPDSTIDLPGDPEDAIRLLDELLADTGGLARRRMRNVAECARRHDTRHRLKSLLEHAGLPLPEGLRHGLKRLEDTARDLSGELSGPPRKDHIMSINPGQ